MLLFFDNKQQSRKIGAVLMICLLLFCHSSFAQHDQALPDSIHVDDSINAPGGGADTSNHISTDTASTYNTNAEDSVIFRKVPDSITTAFQKSRDFAYANDPEYWIERPIIREKNFFDYLVEWIRTPVFRGLVFLLLASILLFALYKIIVSNNLYMFYSSPKEKAIAPADETDLPLENLEDRIQEALNTNDFRSATRYMYLKLLKLAGDRGLIHFHAQCTNQEYIDQMAGHSQAALFRFLTNAYEYAWYGGFDLRSEQFGSLKKHFEHFYNTINS